MSAQSRTQKKMGNANANEKQQQVKGMAKENVNAQDKRNAMITQNGYAVEHVIVNVNANE